MGRNKKEQEGDIKHRKLETGNRKRQVRKKGVLQARWVQFELQKEKECIGSTLEWTCLFKREKNLKICAGVQLHKKYSMAGILGNSFETADFRKPKQTIVRQPEFRVEVFCLVRLLSDDEF